jgi:hypothetical protein
VFRLLQAGRLRRCIRGSTVGVLASSIERYQQLRINAPGIIRDPVALAHRLLALELRIEALEQSGVTADNLARTLAPDGLDVVGDGEQVHPDSQPVDDYATLME